MTRSAVIRTIILLVAALAASTRRAAAETLHQRVSVADTIRLGVLPFETAKVDSTLGYALADLVANDIASIRRLKVVETTRLGEVLRELDLARAPFVDPASAPRTGRLLGANRLVLGSLHAEPTGLMFEARVVVSQTGVIDTAVRAPADSNDILLAQKQVTFEILNRLGIRLTPRERESIEQRRTKSREAIRAYGEGVRAELAGDFSGARRSFRRAARLDPQFKSATMRLRESEVSTIRNEGTVVSGATDAVNPPAPDVPKEIPRGSAVDPVIPARRATIIITIVRP